MRTITITSLCLALFVVATAQQLRDSSTVDYENPVRSAEEDEIKNLPGLTQAINFKQYSGYLKAGSKGSKNFFHYWFIERETNPENAPILLWLNGGPGCSSMGGLFTELGAFSVNEDGETLKLNDYSWNKVANVLFLESPADVGFSYTISWNPVHTDDSTARENHQALKSFMEKFPQYKKNPLYLSGESYAGVYLPTLGVLVDADPELNLKGIAIGNGYLDARKLSDSLVFFSYAHGLAGKSAWDKLSKECCNGQPPSRKACNFTYIGSCDTAVAKVLQGLDNTGLNPYNLYAPCLNAPNGKKISSREVVDRALMSLAFNTSMLADPSKPFHVFDVKEHQRLGDEPPCFDDHTLIQYLNTKSVRKAIHIPDQVQAWDTCSALAYIIKYPWQRGGLAPQMKSLIGSKRKLAMLVYNGDVDTVCNFLGDEWFVDDLGRKVISEYQTWHADNQVAGYVKHYDGITFATVRGSGHMVPGDRPVEALKMIKTFLDSNCTNVML